VRGDDELGAGTGRGDDHGDQGQAARGRQRGLGLVEDVEAVGGEAVLGQREERLAVGLLVELDAAVERDVGREAPALVDLPVPLSPASRVIGWPRSSVPASRTAGTSNGNPSPGGATPARPVMNGPGPKTRRSSRRGANA
jgi:hypothetical protein